MRKTYDELTFADDFLFCRIMQDESICSRVIETLLGIPVGRIEYLNAQQEGRSDYDGRGVRFDVYVKNSDRVIDLEMQTVVKPELLKRARYYQAMIDIENLKRSQGYLNLKESYVVFICLRDPFKDNLVRYTFRQHCLELQADQNTDTKDRYYDDGTRKVFYNVSAWEHADDAAVQAFLKYLATHQASDMLTTYEIGYRHGWR